MGYGLETLGLVLEYLPEGGSIVEMGAQLFHGKGKKYEGPTGEWFVENGYEYVAIDIKEGPLIAKLDLNKDPYFFTNADVVTNFGTSEHIINQLAVFKFIHNACAFSGTMLHVVPSGREGHGFFNYDPKFFKLLAKANSYKTLILQNNEPSGHILAVFQKIYAAEFVPPLDLEAR